MKVLSKINVYLFAFFTLLCSKSIFTTFSVKKYIYAGAVLFALLAFIFKLIYSKSTSDDSLLQIKFSSRNIFKLILLFLLLLVYLSIHATYWGSNKGNLMMFLLLFFFFLPLFWIFFTLFGYREFFQCCCNLIVIFATLSVLLWLLVSVTHVISPNSIVTINWGYSQNVNTFHNIYFETQGINIFGQYLTRNTGIWPEAPMYVTVLSFGLLIECYIIKRRSPFVLTALTVTIASTFATSGFMVLFLMLGFYGFSKMKNKNSFALKILVFCVVMSLAIFASIYLILLIKNKLNTTSGSIRLDDYVVGIESFIRSPFFGHGFNNTEFLVQFMNLNIRQGSINGILSFNTGIANGWVQVLSDGGILLALFYGYILLNGIFSSKENVGKQKVFFIIFVMMFFLAMSYNAIFVAVMAYSLCDFSISKEEGINRLTRGELI